MATTLDANLINNIAHNYCYLYNAWEAHDDLKKIFRVIGEQKYYLYKLLVQYKGEVVKEHGDIRSNFTGRLTVNPHHKLLEALSRDMFFKKTQMYVEKALLWSQYGKSLFKNLLYVNKCKYGSHYLLHSLYHTATDARVKKKKLDTFQRISFWMCLSRLRLRQPTL